MPGPPPLYAPACLNAAAHSGGILFSRCSSTVLQAVIQPQRRGTARPRPQRAGPAGKRSRRRKPALPNSAVGFSGASWIAAGFPTPMIFFDIAMGHRSFRAAALYARARSQPAAVSADAGDDRLSLSAAAHPALRPAREPHVSCRSFDRPSIRPTGKRAQGRCRPAKKSAFTAARRTFRFLPRPTHDRTAALPGAVFAPLPSSRGRVGTSFGPKEEGSAHGETVKEHGYDHCNR